MGGFCPVMLSSDKGIVNEKAGRRLSADSCQSFRRTSISMYVGVCTLLRNSKFMMLEIV